MKYVDAMVSKDNNTWLGLTKIVGKKVKEVHGYISSEYGEPTFILVSVEFEDGTDVSCEGEHDMPYLVDGTYEFDEDSLNEIRKTDPDYEPDEDND